MTTTERWLWLAAYTAFLLLWIAGVVTVAVAAWRSFRPNARDVAYIQLHREAMGSSGVSVRRISSFSRLWLGGVVELSNGARMYVVTGTSPFGSPERFYYAADPITGRHAMRVGGAWLDV